MIDFHKAAKQAQRRLWLIRWLSMLGWSLAVAAGLFVLAVVIERAFQLTGAGGVAFGYLALGLSGAALVASGVWLILCRDSISDAAARLDEAAGLKERISSALYCEKQDDPFASAVVEDARKAARGLSVKRLLPVRVPYSANYAGATLLAALLFFWLFPALDLAGKEAKRDEQEKKQEELAVARNTVKPIVERRVQQMKEKYPDLQKELDDLKPREDAPLDKPRDVISEPIKQINKLEEKLKQREDSTELGKVNEFQKMARSLAALQQKKSPASDLAKAMAKGDFAAAQKALQQIEAKLKQVPRNEAERQQAQQLQQQLKQIAQKLEQAAESDKRNRRDLKDAGLTQEEIEKALQNIKQGDMSALEKMMADKGLSQQKIDKLSQQMKKRAAACKAANQMAQNLAAAAGSQGSQGQMSQEQMQGFSGAGQQLSEMESLEQQLSQLGMAQSDLQQMKQQLGQACGQCNGTGQKNGQPGSACGGTGKCGGMGQGAQQAGRTPGMGPQGQGEGGIAPEQATNIRTQREKAKVNTLPGRIIDTQFIEGEQVSGEVSDEFVEATVAAQREVTDTIEREKLPRVYHSSLKRYFDHTVKALPPEKVKAAESNGDAASNDAGE